MVFLSRLLLTEVSKQTLMSLRKATGHSFQHCKKALQETNNDVKQAITWLEAESLKQGWMKLERAEARVAQQGVFALAGQGTNLVAVTEVNCETDFVARNSELRGFAKKVSETLCQEVQKSAPPATMQTVPWEKLSQLIMDGQSVEESRARLVAKVGEKLNLRHSLVVAAGDGERIAAACHPDDIFGKYGAVLLYKGGDDDTAERICRHIIGMKPSSVGTMKMLEELNAAEEANEAAEQANKAAEQANKAVEADETKRDADTVTEQQSADSDDAESAAEEARKRSRRDNERRLLLQEFVFDTDTSVGELLQEKGMEVKKFWRFECAQDVVESKE